MYTTIRKSWLRYIDFIIIDLVCIEIAFVMGFILRHGMQNPFILSIYQKMGIALIMVQIIIGFFNESYKHILRRGYLEELKAVFMHSSLCLGGIFAYMFLMRMTGEYSRMVLISMWFYSIVFIYLGRIIWKRVVDYIMIKRGNIRSIMLVSQKKYAESCLEVLETHRYVAYKIASITIVDEDCSGQEIHGIPVVATQDNVTEHLKTHIVDEVFINIFDDMELVENLTERFLEAGIAVHQSLAKITRTSINERVIENFGGYVVVSTSIKIATPRQMIIKRLIDIFGSLLGLIVTGVAFLFVTPIIFIQSPGPIFFSQERVGRNGRRFKIYKFRSMRLDAEDRKAELMKYNEMQGFMFKMKDDPRIIPIGKFLRKTSIDELPQMWNILKGDMSLVGTRPPTVEEWEQYSLKDLKRLSIKPGLTGLWQVSGRSKIIDFQEVVALDTKYITEWSLGMDLKILFKTIQVVLLQKGSE